MRSTGDGLLLPEMGVRIRAEGQRLVFADAVTGDIFSDNEQLYSALQSQRQRAEQERNRADTAEAEVMRLRALLDKMQ